MSPQIILASASPRRSELLKQIGVRHRVVSVDIDEAPLPHEAPDAYVARVAAEKSEACRLVDRSGLPILAADTSVILDGRILGKPADLQHAIEMLSRLSGRTHQVFSAVSLRGDRHWQAISVSEVRFRPLSHQEIVAYWQTGEPCDKAGAYAIQGLASTFIESMAGSFSGVMGLPLFETAQLLAQQGITILP
ncbi:Maf family protein [Methylomonas sp. LWB]|uniref:Maf family protein n=1 Tax=unclassified Methylomonas TaxID=2608980 RepID=UPI0008DB292C|nr:nucleoside triphosphate pyrophosphatase [Methylomonas sp. LWB]NJA04638.1 septum formation inhibitor Maf [Methylococcaceae bacterium WWC4]OHX34181.1 septum formation protein Maf [Methylomonas sp. LWB]